MSGGFITSYQEKAYGSTFGFGGDFGQHQSSPKIETESNRYENQTYLSYIDRIISNKRVRTNQKMDYEAKEQPKNTTKEAAIEPPTLLACNKPSFSSIPTDQNEKFAKSKLINEITFIINAIWKNKDLQINNSIECDSIQSGTTTHSHVTNEKENTQQKYSEKTPEYFNQHNLQAYNPSHKTLTDTHSETEIYKYLVQMLKDLDQILLDNDYNEDYLKPTDYAIETVRYLLSNIKPLLNQPFPRGTIYPDGDGGIRIEWMTEGIELRLITPATKNGKQYIYHELANDYGVNYNTTPNELSERLKWFNCNDPSRKSTMGSTKL